jgi:glycoside/pentoside/hexuronide:cation symporter, GPH family
MQSASRRLTLAEKIAYALGDVACNLFWTIFSVYLVFFYTDIYGISAAAAGTLLLVTRVWDSLNNPIMGLIADRTDTRWGKFRPYLLWGGLPFAIAAICAFTTPDLGSTGKLVYAYITYTVMMTLYTVISIPYSSLLGVITLNSQEREVVSSYRFGFALAAGLFVQFFTLELANYFGNGNLQDGFQSTVILYAVIAVILLWMTFFFTRERVRVQEEKQSSIKQDLNDLMRNKPWLILFVVSLITVTYLTIRTAASLYYFKYVVADESMTKWFLAGGSLCLVLGTVYTKYLVKHFRRSRLFASLLLADGFLMSFFYVVDPSNLVAVFLLHFVAMLFLGPSIVMIWAMYGDTADYSEWRRKRRATGLIYSASVLAQKMAAAIGSALLGWLLAYYGFIANQQQTEDVQQGIKLLMSLYPGVLSFVGALIVLFYPLEQSVMLKIEQSLNERKK